MKFELTNQTENGQLRLTFEEIKQDEAIELVKHAAELVENRVDPVLEALKRSLASPIYNDTLLS